MKGIFLFYFDRMQRTRVSIWGRFSFSLAQRSRSFLKNTKKQQKNFVKLKRQPEDFVVQEVTDSFQYGPDWGPFAVYSLKKTTMETQHAIYAMAEEIGVKRDDVHFGGLKDKHAETTQFVTVENGPKRSFEQKSFSVTYLGDAKRHFHSSDILGNKFRIVLRNLSAPVVPFMDKAIQERITYGFPNYYGAQRFGSVGFSGEFAAKLWCEREYERALHLLFTDEYQFEKGGQRKFRDIAGNYWGEWAKMKKVALNNLEEIKEVKLFMKVLDHLILHPNDYLSAFMKFPKHLRAIWLAAYQSFIWNLMASSFLERKLTHSDCTFSYRDLSPSLTQLGKLAFYNGVTEEKLVQLKRIQLPMISKRTKVSTEPLIEDVISETLGNLHITMDELALPAPRDCFFTDISRNLIEFPLSMTHKWITDEYYPSKKALSMEFTLGRGVYATTFFSSLHTLAEQLAKQDQQHAYEQGK